MQILNQIFGALGIEPQYILVLLVGFLILMWVLVKFAFGPMVRTLQARQDKIRGDLDEAEKSRNDMVSLQREYELKLAKIEDEARDKIQSAVKEAGLARDEIIAKAHTDAQLIVQRGQEEAASERTKALTDARNQIVDLATLMARQSARENLSAAGQAGLIDDAIRKIGVLN